jgi:integrase
VVIARVNRFMPRETRIKKDRAYTSEEIFHLLQLANERTRAIILLLCSTGIRLGGLAGLQLCDVEERERTSIRLPSMEIQRVNILLTALLLQGESLSQLSHS